MKKMPHPLPAAQKEDAEVEHQEVEERNAATDRGTGTETKDPAVVAADSVLCSASKAVPTDSGST